MLFYIDYQFVINKNIASVPKRPSKGQSDKILGAQWKCCKRYQNFWHLLKVLLKHKRPYQNFAAFLKTNYNAEGPNLNMYKQKSKV